MGSPSDDHSERDARLGHYRHYCSVTIATASETRRLRERPEVSVVMADSVSDAGAMDLAKKIEKAPYALSVGVITKDDALKNWKTDT